MKKILLILLSLLPLLTLSARQPYRASAEKLQYRVMFKWGIISKQAGTVTLETHTFEDGYFSSTLVGHSAKWADSFYSVRDTLIGTIMEKTFEPVYYEKISHEGGAFKRDIIEYERDTDTIVGNCRRWRQDKKTKQLVHSEVSISGTGTTLDMLSSFYYMRHVDYRSMKAGQSVVTNIFSGTKKETLTITYHGLQILQVDDKKYTCFYITFTFTQGNGKKSSDDMSAWISIDTDRIPVKLMGSLPVGSIQCYYVP